MIRRTDVDCRVCGAQCYRNLSKPQLIWARQFPAVSLTEEIDELDVREGPWLERTRGLCPRHRRPLGATAPGSYATKGGGSR